MYETKHKELRSTSPGPGYYKSFKSIQDQKTGFAMNKSKKIKDDSHWSVIFVLFRKWGQVNIIANLNQKRKLRILFSRMPKGLKAAFLRLQLLEIVLVVLL